MEVERSAIARSGTSLICNYNTVPIMISIGRLRNAIASGATID
jgi:hypothetical protein